MIGKRELLEAASSFQLLMGGGPSYVFRCMLCGKTFERKSMDGALNPHKHPNGYACPGRVGVYVRTKY